MTKRTHRRRIFLREWRKHRNLSQEALASRLDVDRTIISKIENGKLDYHQSFLEAAAEALACEPADLLVRNPLSADAIWSVWDQIPEQDRPAALAVLNALKNASKKAL